MSSGRSFTNAGNFFLVVTERRTIKLRSDGTSAAVLTNDRHACGGRIWTHLLPLGEKEPRDPKPQPKRPAKTEDDEHEI